jgi:hypothetical protein
MKKILSLLLAVSVLGFVACSDDSDGGSASAPTLSLSSNTAQDVPGATVTVTATITAPGGAKTLTVSGVSPQTIPVTGTSATEEVELTIPATAAVGSTLAAVFVVTDQADKASAPVTLTITVGDPIITLEGVLTTQTLDASKQYLLKNQVFVNDGIVLTIPAGTVIKGEKATRATLVVKPGGQLICNGTASNPVVFTSNQAPGERDRGDWGGIVLLGNAFVNQNSKPNIEGISPLAPYGSSVVDDNATPATNADDNSGTLTYVRIEYAGIELTPNNETNSLTMGAIGKGTTIDYVQIAFGGDDGFEWFGGTVDCKHLFSLGTWDDDFDTDFGFSGRVQFAASVRYPFFADQSESNGFESDNQGNGNAIAGICEDGNTAGCTSAIFSNVSIFGPRDITSPARPMSGNFRNAMHIRRRSALSIFNSYFSGFRIGLRIDDAGTATNFITNGNGRLANNVLVVPGTVVNVGSPFSTTPADASFATGLNLGAGAGDATGLKDYWAANNNEVINVSTPWTVTENPYNGLGIDPALYWGANAIGAYPSAPNFAVTTGTLADGADFEDAKLDDFFEVVEYRGAFGTTDWTDGWAEFQPLTKAY